LVVERLLPRLAHEVGAAQPPPRNVGEHFRAALFEAVEIDGRGDVRENSCRNCAKNAASNSLNS
jgi:hypothetical protein